MKLLVVLIITVIIFVLVYFSSERNTKKAAICAALAAAIAFAGPYIVNLGETKEPSTGSAQENKHSDDSSAYPDDQNSSNSEEGPNQIVQPENQPPAEVSLPTPDSELNIDKIAAAKMEVQNIESKIILEAQSPVFPRLKRSRCRSSQEVNDSPTPFSALNYC